MSIEPIEVWGHWGAPNPWKVVIVLEALALPYTIHYLELNEVKMDSYLKLTPNGRLPTIHDSNTSLTLWEVSFARSGYRFAPLLRIITVRRDHPIPSRRVRQG